MCSIIAVMCSIIAVLCSIIAVHRVMAIPGRRIPSRCVAPEVEQVDSAQRLHASELVDSAQLLA
jgi:hypothetical protein